MVNIVNNTRPAPRARAKLWPALYVLGFFLAVGTGLFAISGSPGNLVFFVLVGIFIATGFTIHACARPRRRRWGARLSLVAVGLSLFLGAGVFGRQSFQLEGFLFYLLHGAMGGVVIHYLVAKIVGPLVIGRAYCGWGCWTWMLLHFLPFKRGQARPVGKLSRLRVVHLVASATLVAGLWFLLDYRHGTDWKTTDGLIWFLAGNALYYVLAVLLAIVYRDNRAFCKILCPITVLMRPGARLSLLKVRGDRAACTSCGACDRACPMNVPVSRSVAEGRRVVSSECTLCQGCIGVCPERNLELSLGFDRGVRRSLCSQAAERFGGARGVDGPSGPLELAPPDRRAREAGPAFVA